MTRIVSGSAGGRRLRTPAGSDTRPTSDRVREALFSRLDHLDVLAGARVLDLYAGSGSTGVAAKRINRRAVLFELRESQCEKSARRLAQDALNFGGAA